MHLLGDGDLEHLCHLLDDPGQIQLLDDELPLAGIGEHLARKVRRAAGRLLYLDQVLTCRRFRGNPHQRQVGVSQHHHEDVVEVVRDPAGQHPQALQFLHVEHLGLYQTVLLFKALPLRGVDGYEHQVMPSLHSKA